MIATIFRLSDGAALRVFEGPEEWLAETLPEGHDWIEGDHLGMRIDLADDLPVPLYDFAVTVSEARIDGIPAGSHAEVEGDVVRIDDGFLEIAPSAGIAQDVRVVLRHPLYAETEVPVSCPATS